MLFHLFMHSRVASCVCPDQGSNWQPWRIEITLQPAELHGQDKPGYSLKKKKKDFTHLFIYFRERGREAKRGRETLISCLACTLTRSQTGDLQFAGRCPTQEPHLGKPGYFPKPLFIRLMVGSSTSVFFCLSDENQCRANSALLCTLTHK